MILKHSWHFFSRLTKFILVEWKSGLISVIRSHKILLHLMGHTFCLCAHVFFFCFLRAMLEQNFIMCYIPQIFLPINKIGVWHIVQMKGNLHNVDCKNFFWLVALGKEKFQLFLICMGLVDVKDKKWLLALFLILALWEY